MVADVFTAAFIVAVIYLLARPQSAAGEAMRAFFDAVAALVRAATDL